MDIPHMNLPYEARELRNILDAAAQRSHRAVPNDERIYLHDPQGNVYTLWGWRIDEQGIHFRMKEATSADLPDATETYRSRDDE